jgi:hypothetical protein
MNLRASLAKVQNLGARFYLHLAKHFSENALIRETWAAMADDFDRQLSSLRELRPVFWKQLKTEEKTLLTAVRETSGLLHAEFASPPSEWSLQRCFARTLGFEEPIIIRLYAPLLYRLRNVGTDHALDFYITVNAHVTRLTRLIQLFSGDPALIQRCTALLENFEKTAQAPQPQPVLAKKQKITKAAVVRQKPVTSPLKRRQKAVLKARKKAKPAPRLAKRAKVIAKRPKPLVKNINLHRTRARR